MSGPLQESGANLHARQSLLQAGAPLAQAEAVLVCIHGRGASARDILQLGGQVAPAQAAARGLCLLAPQAANGTWYPNRFVAPAASNEPWLGWALERVQSIVTEVEAAGVPSARILLLGFSQGACLALEAAARRPARYGGLIGLSGALIEEGDQPRSYAGDLAGTPVFLGCSDVDFHSPLERVQRSERLLAAMGGAVTMRIYPGMDHTV
ncbi:MAG: alpha/beta hydrolase, partial [Caldilineaceae bacterium]